MADLFVVIPVFNEEESLPVLWPELRAVLTDLGVSFEVAFVDDGSRDRSAEIIRALRDRTGPHGDGCLDGGCGLAGRDDRGHEHGAERAGGRGLVQGGLDLSTDNSFNAGSDVRLGARTVTSLVAGGVSAKRSNLTLSGGTAPGTYRIIVRVDDEEAVVEASESNNVRATPPITIGP